MSEYDEEAGRFEHDSNEDAEDDDDDDEDERCWPDSVSCKRFEEDFRYEPVESPLRPYQEQAVEALLEALRWDTPALLHLATGGGKTRVANEFISQLPVFCKSSVLWVTKDWRLLYQAASDMSRRITGSAPLARIGGDSTVLQYLREWSEDAAVVYTTLHTFSRRIPVLRRLRPAVVIWDECHWGEQRKLGRRLKQWCKNRGVPLIGLTGTPRSGDSSFRVCYSRSFAELVADGHLARPILVPRVETGVHWNPERTNRGDGDATPSSLRELAGNLRRNKAIVDHYLRHVEKYGETIVFACDIEHANELAELFCRKGVPSRPVHSRQDNELNQGNLRALLNGELKVLVNVAMLTHGIDIPRLRTVFLARPTFSDILFSQMVGRGSRLDVDTDKRTFFVVEFADQLERFGDQLVSSHMFFDVCDVSFGALPGGYLPSKQRVSHAFDPTGQPRLIPNERSIPEPMRGLWYREGQTFGFEIELTSRDHRLEDISEHEWNRIANGVLRRLREELSNLVAEKPIRVYGGEKSLAVWNVEFDSSCGWEVTTRILENAEGMHELIRGCLAVERAAEELGLAVNWRTGLHLHIGWIGQQPYSLNRAIRLVRLFEPALATLVAPSRIIEYSDGQYNVSHPNRYCRPISSVFRACDLEGDRRLDPGALGDDDRYVSFNVKPLRYYHTVEVRLHNGTLDPGKMLLWLSLWQQLLWSAEHGPTPPAVPDSPVIRPTGDIIELSRKFLPAVDQEYFLERLENRRQEIYERWRNDPTLSLLAPDEKTWTRWAADRCR